MTKLYLFKKSFFSAFVFAFFASYSFSASKLTRFDADDSRIQIVGRVDYTNPKVPQFSFSGSYIIAHFQGDSCIVYVKDEHKWGKNCNYVQVIIDNEPAFRFQTQIGKTQYTFAAKLSKSEHEITIIKDSESSIGYLEFQGFSCEELLIPTSLPSRKIECFGNSITCGAGTITSLCDTSKDSNWYLCTSAYHSYGYLLAKNLNAQYHITSQSGIGLIHSCCDMPNNMMESYDRMHIDKPDDPKWNFSNYIPDVVTLALGQNDGMQDSALFCGKYIEFVGTLRKLYPEAHFFLLTSPMSDDKLLEYQKMVMTAVENHFQKTGDSKVHKVFLTNKLNNGCTTHPDAEQHKIVAAELTEAIKKVMNW